jgi:hypothetical protein
MWQQIYGGKLKYMKGKLKALRTNCFTGKETEVEIEYELTDKIFRITKGGCTGFECWNATPRFIEQFLNNPEKKPFCACMGDVGYNFPHYDKLLIPADQMKKVFETEMEQQQIEAEYNQQKEDENAKAQWEAEQEEIANEEYEGGEWGN